MKPMSPDSVAAAADDSAHIIVLESFLNAGNPLLGHVANVYSSLPKADCCFQRDRRC